MSRVRIAFALIVAVLASAGANAAGLSRAYLLSTGSDANPCTLQFPCLTLPAALHVIPSGGEVWILDSYTINTSQVAISKSVSILGVAGASPAIVATAGGSGIFVKGTNLKIGLNHLVFTNDVNSPGTNGIIMGSSGSQISVEDSLFTDLPGSGMLLSGAPLIVHVKGTIFRNLAGTAMTVQDGATADVTNSQFLSTAGILVQEVNTPWVTQLNLSDSVISDVPNGAGVRAVTSVPAGVVYASVTRTTITRADTGISCDAPVAVPPGMATVAVSNSTIVNNNVGIAQSNLGLCESLGNNHLENGLDVSGTLTTKALQ